MNFARNRFILCKHVSMYIYLIHRDTMYIIRFKFKKSVKMNIFAYKYINMSGHLFLDLVLFQNLFGPFEGHHLVQCCRNLVTQWCFLSILDNVIQNTNQILERMSRITVLHPSSLKGNVLKYIKIFTLKMFPLGFFSLKYKNSSFFKTKKCSIQQN